ncbi:MAG: type II toxin-antitoxin system VapC family toxin [Phycisphaerales bacterium]|nr:type II toxin-antitoxin system VapC family toxin [Phycisphaerales bacterium]
MARVYLETSFFSACVSTRMEAFTVTWKATSLEWWNTQASRHELFVSPEVVAELSDTRFKERINALAMLRGLHVLELTDEARGFAETLVREKLMPRPSVSGDAIHVSTATVHRMEYLVTWNVRHLANPKKRMHLAKVCLRLALVPPEIVTPDMLMESDE